MPAAVAINKMDRFVDDATSTRSGLVEPPTRTDKPIMTPIAPAPDDARYEIILDWLRNNRAPSKNPTSAMMAFIIIDVE